MSKKSIIEDCLILDINRLFRKCALRPELCMNGTIDWESGSSAGLSVVPSGLEEEPLIMTLTYRRHDLTIVIDIPIVSTHCNYGGERYWFRCPGSLRNTVCNNRAARLYLPPGAERFACRRCHDLSYKSRQTWKSVTEIGLCFQILDAGRKMEEALILGRKGGKKMKRIHERLERIAALARKRGVINGI